MAENGKSAAQLQREVEAQRSRIESRIGEIQSRLSPGQLLDEALAYTRNGPASEFVGNLGRSVTANPLPIALMGVSLVWLMARPPATGAAGDGRLDNGAYASGRYDAHRADHPLAPIRGGALTRMGHAADEGGQRYSEFADETGRKFRALTDEAGNRAGHFVDETGDTFRGFVDETGSRVTQFRDEAGELIDEAAGWASHTWSEATHGVRDLGRDVAHGIAAGGERLHRRAADAGAAIGAGSDRVAGAVTGAFRDQPLVGGAVAFALGAMIAAVLPRTRQEDALLGETADKVRNLTATQATHLAEDARDKAAELDDEAAGAVAEVYETAKEATGRGKERLEDRLGTGAGSSAH